MTGPSPNGTMLTPASWRSVEPNASRYVPAWSANERTPAASSGAILSVGEMTMAPDGGVAVAVAVAVGVGVGAGVPCG